MAPAIAVAASAVAGCGSSTGQASGNSVTAGVVAQTGGTARGGFSVARLRGALLTRINGIGAIAPAQSGAYASLPQVKVAKESMQGVTVIPAVCAKDTSTGFNSAGIGDAPAAVATFRVGHNGVSEVLVAPSRAAADDALGKAVPAECDHYRASVSGKTFRYAVKESYISGIGDEARVLNVTTAGYPQLDVWSLVYRGNGFIGAVTVVGPNSSQAAVRQLAQQAYSYAAKSLS